MSYNDSLCPYFRTTPPILELSPSPSTPTNGEASSLISSRPGTMWRAITTSGWLPTSSSTGSMCPSRPPQVSSRSRESTPMWQSQHLNMPHSCHFEQRCQYVTAGNEYYMQLSSWKAFIGMTMAVDWQLYKADEKIDLACRYNKNPCTAIET